MNMCLVNVVPKLAHACMRAVTALFDLANVFLEAEMNDMDVEQLERVRL